MATNWYVATTGLDTNAGTSLATAFLTIGKAVSSAASGDTINIQTGTYVQTAAITLTQATLSIIGFQFTAGDGGSPPTITTSTNSIALIATAQNGGTQLFQNLLLTNTAGTPGSGIWQLTQNGLTQWWIFNDCLFDGFLKGIDTSNTVQFDVNYVTVNRTEIRNCTTGFAANGVNTGTFSFSFTGCYIHNNGTHLLINQAVATTFMVDCIFANATSAGAAVSALLVLVSNCTFYNNAGSGLGLNSTADAVIVTNCIFYGNVFGVDVAGTPNFIIASGLSGHKNAYKNTNTTFNPQGNLNWPGNPDDILLTANPFNNASAGDFSLNSTSGGGAACKGAGYPGTFPSGLSVSHLDIGAVQTSGGSSGSGGSNFTYLS